MRRTISSVLLLLAMTTACGKVLDLSSLTYVRTIGPGGGTVFLDGFEVEIPAGALSSNRTFVVSRPDQPPEGAIGPVFLVEPEGVDLSTAVTISLAVDTADLPPEVQAGNLALSWFDGASWVPLETSTWDGEAERLTGLSGHLSLWAAACVPSCPTSACEGPDGCGGTCPACPPKMLDVLWVVDNSAGMCQPQQGLVRNFTAFVDALPPETLESLNMAVINTDAYVGQGVFSTAVAEMYPVACAGTKLQACMEDVDCQDALGDGWMCNPPPSTGGAPLHTNRNGSLNSSCTYACETTHQCCDVFCPDGVCGDCIHECRFGWDNAEEMNCIPEPLPCLGESDGDWEEWARCHLQVGVDQSFTANLESGIKAAWMALDPEGPNAAQSAGFLRDDAHLLIVFVSDEDDCSIHEDFCSPSYDCENDDDCPGPSECRDGLCCGTVKKDYYNLCSLLGEYKGPEHHDCAYDQDCADCETDEDCEPNWFCEAGKCRPMIYGFHTVASFQEPVGTPIFSLVGTADYQNRFESLKEAPRKVMVAAIAGDALISADDAASMISAVCLEDPDLERCQDYLAAKAAPETPPACLADPLAQGCEAFLLTKQDCARQCYLSSKGDDTNPQAKNSYICTSDDGSANWGSRYALMTYMFGVNGLRQNLCDPEGFGPVLQRLGEFAVEKME